MIWCGEPGTSSAPSWAGQTRWCSRASASSGTGWKDSGSGSSRRRSTPSLPRTRTGRCDRCRDVGHAASARTVSTPADLPRDDGAPARVSREAMHRLRRTAARRHAAVAQVSRWDRLKDPVGLLALLRRARDGPRRPPGPRRPRRRGGRRRSRGRRGARRGRAALRALPDDIRERVHLISLPMDDLEENAAMVNALQRRADIVVQKSLAEGFGLTVAEAMWKQSRSWPGRSAGSRIRSSTARAGCS